MRHFFLLKSIAGIFFISVMAFASFISCTGDNKKKTDITLRYYMWGSPVVTEIHREIIDLFQKEHPNIKVRLEVSNWGAYWDKLQVQLASNTAPDVYWMSPAYFFNFADEGLFLNLKPLIQRDSINIHDYFFVQDIFKDPVHTYGLPKDMTTVVLYYNKNMFDEAGISYPDTSWDWHDFLKAAQKLTKDKDGDGNVDQWGTGAFMPWIEEYIAPMVFSNGGLILNEKKTRCLLDQPKAVQAIQLMVDFLKKYQICVLPSQTASIGGDPFMTGQVAMIQNISALIPEYSKIKTFEWAIAPIPKSPNTGRRVTSALGLVHVINSKTQYPDAAWELVKFFSSEKAQRFLAKKKVFAPALKKVAYEVFAVPPPDNVIEVLRAYDYGRDLQFTKNWLEWSNAVRRELEPAFLGNKSVLEACRSAARAVDRILESEM